MTRYVVPVSRRIWTPLREFGPPNTTKLSENTILNVLVKMDDTLRSSAYQSMFLIQNMRIVNAYELASCRMFNVWREVVFEPFPR